MSKKKTPYRFPDHNTCKLYELLGTYIDAAKTFRKFCKNIYKLYPRSKENQKWFISNIDKLVGKISRIGIFY